jgi:hypothetical protein
MAIGDCRMSAVVIFRIAGHRSIGPSGVFARS